MSRAVSIAIPCHNHWRFMDECLASLIAQTHAEWEAIVVDDGSTQPGFEETRARWSDSRIRWVQHPRALGPAGARNSAIRAARHAIVVTLDADDALHPEYLEKLLRVLEADPTLDCVFPDFEFFGLENYRHEFRERDHAELAHWQYLPAQVMMRRALWERAGGYCEDPGLPAGNEDWDFWLAAAEADYRAAHLPEPLYRYRTAEGSLSSRLRAVDHISREFMYRRHRAFINRHGSRGQFVGAGYWCSARAACAKGELLASVRLAIRGLALDWNFSAAFDLLRNLLRATLPASTVRAIRKLRLRAAASPVAHS